MGVVFAGVTLLIILTALMMWNEKKQQRDREQRAQEALVHAQRMIVSVAEAALRNSERQRAEWHRTQVQRAEGMRRDIERVSQFHRKEKTNWQKEGF